MPSAIIFVSKNDAENRLSGETPSPTLALSMPRNRAPTNRKQKNKKKISSLVKYITLDKVIYFPNWDLNNLTFEKIVILQDILARKKRQEEM